MTEHYNVLFLCTGNSARSIIAEGILNHNGRSRFFAYSAGSHPTGKVRPEALEQLLAAHIPIAGLHSKSWNDFAKPDGPRMDYVFTVCDNVTDETCPLWPGQPITAHWGVPDPAAVEGTPEEIERAFHNAFCRLERRIGLFLAVPLATLDPLKIQQSIEDIGKQ